MVFGKIKKGVDKGVDKATDPLDKGVPKTGIEKRLEKMLKKLKNFNDSMKKFAESSVTGPMKDTIDFFDDEIIGFMDKFFAILKKKSKQIFELILELLLAVFRVVYIFLAQSNLVNVLYVIGGIFLVGYCISFAQIFKFLFQFFLPAQQAFAVSIVIAIVIFLLIFFNIKKLITKFLGLIVAVFEEIKLDKIVEKIIMENLDIIEKIFT